MKLQIVPQSFIDFPLLADEYIFGESTMPKVIVHEAGDWRSFLPTFEDQRKGGVESYACVTYATQNAIETLMSAQFGEYEDYSERFTATLAGTTKNGNSPQKVSETIRKYGLIGETSLPFSDDIRSFEEYMVVPEEKKPEGKRWSRDWRLQHEWVITRKTRKEEKKERLTESLKLSPVGVSVCAWWEENGVYVKNGTDNHYALLVAGDRDYWYVLDTYPPFVKKLEKGYDFGVAKRYHVERAQAGNWLTDLFRRVFMV